MFTVEEREGQFDVNLLRAPFSTHSFSQGQRMLRLATTEPAPTVLGQVFSAMAFAPDNAVLAPQGYYMLFAVQGNVPSRGAWVHLSSCGTSYHV